MLKYKVKDLRFLNDVLKLKVLSMPIQHALIRIKNYLEAQPQADNSRYATALHDIGRIIDGDYGDMTMTQSFEQIRTIVQGFNTASERYCA